MAGLLKIAGKAVLRSQEKMMQKVHCVQCAGPRGFHSFHSIMSNGTLFDYF